MVEHITNQDSDRKGGWIQIYSGKQFWPLDPRPEDIDIIDIAHALSLKCRYSGHCKRFYSVAEHSVLISYHVLPENALWALLHDAGEAYSADIPRPIKPMLHGWAEVEGNIMKTVCTRFGLPEIEPRDVKRADFAITTDEKMVLMNDGPEWTGLLPPLGVTITGMMPEEAEKFFLDRFNELYTAKGGV